MATAFFAYGANSCPVKGVDKRRCLIYKPLPESKPEEVFFFFECILKERFKIIFMQVKTLQIDLFNQGNPLLLECGSSLENVTSAYSTYGKLNSEGTNAVLVCHALTGNAHAAGILSQIESDKKSEPDCLKNYSEMYLNKPGWWDELIGPGKAINTDKFFVVCTNILGSCYGTTGPASINPLTGKRYGASFPVITVRDMVRVQKKLLDKLNVKKLHSVVGGSLGGMQVLEWGAMFPEFLDSLIPIATSAGHSPWAIAMNEASRNAITNDPEFNGGNYSEQPRKGLSLARKIAMISYRSFDSFQMKFSRNVVENASFFGSDGIFQIENYLNYQGEKIIKRFDANTYLTLSKAMDLHDISRGRSNADDVLGNIDLPALVVGITSDVLYPPSEQKKIASMLKRGVYKDLESIHGHDGFLIDFDPLGIIIKNFLQG